MQNPGYIQAKMETVGLFKTYSLQRLLDELDDIEYFEQPGRKGFFSEILQKQFDLYDILNIQPPS